MRSVYGAGVVKGISERMPLSELFGKTREFIVGSGGGINVAGLVAGQPEIPGRVCREDLQKGFVSYYGAISRIVRGFGRKFGLNCDVNSAPNCVNINYLMDVLENKRKLDDGEIKSCPVPIMMKLFDVEKRRLRYQDIREDPFKVIKKGVSIVPYYTSDSCEVDGDALVPLDINYLLEKRQTRDRIVIVLNYAPERKAKHSLKSWLERMVAEEVFPGIGKVIAEKDARFMENVRRIESAGRENILFVYPDKSDPTRSRTTDPKKLRISYEMGRRDAKRIVEFVRNGEN